MTTVKLRTSGSTPSRISFFLFASSFSLRLRWTRSLCRANILPRNIYLRSSEQRVHSSPFASPLTKYGTAGSVRQCLGPVSKYTSAIRLIWRINRAPFFVALSFLLHIFFPKFIPKTFLVSGPVWKQQFYGRRSFKSNTGATSFSFF